MNMNEDEEKIWDLVDADEALAEHGWESVSRLERIQDDKLMDDLGISLGKMCAPMRSISIDASVNDSSWETLDVEVKPLRTIDDELTELLRKWGVQDAGEALAKHGWNSISRLKIFKRDEHMDELGLPSGTVCALEILLQSLVTTTLEGPAAAALPVAAATTADLHTVSLAAEPAAAVATPAVVPAESSAASLRTVAPTATAAAIRLRGSASVLPVSAATTADLWKVDPSAAPAALVTTPALVSTSSSAASLRTVAPRSTTSAIRAIAPPTRTTAAAATLRVRIFVDVMTEEELKRNPFELKPYLGFWVKSSDTIVILKDMIEQWTQIPLRKQRVFFDGKELMDGRTLDECNIQDNAKLKMKITSSSSSASVRYPWDVPLPLKLDNSFQQRK